MQYTGWLKPGNINGNPNRIIFRSLGQKNIILFPIRYNSQIHHFHLQWGEKYRLNLSLFGAINSLLKTLFSRHESRSMNISIRIPMSHLGHLTEACYQWGITSVYSERDNPYTVSPQQIYALGKAISYTYLSFIACERRIKILYCKRRYKLLCTRLSKSNIFSCGSLHLVIWEMNIQNISAAMCRVIF